MDINELKDFFVVDTETTGVKIPEADAIEVSALKVHRLENGDFKVVDAFDIYINPEYPLPATIVEFNKKHETGINDELLSTAPLVSEAAQKVKDFLGENPVVVGHNINNFDLKILNKMYNKGLSEDFIVADTVDTLLLSRAWVNGKKHNLETMFEFTEKKFSAENPKFHNAVSDCYATLDVLDYLNKTFKPYTYEKEDAEYETFGETYSELNQKKEQIVSYISDGIRNLPIVMLDTDINELVIGVEPFGKPIPKLIGIGFDEQSKFYSQHKNIDATNQIDVWLKCSAAPIVISAMRNIQNKDEVVITGFYYKNKDIINHGYIKLDLSKEKILGEDMLADYMSSTEKEIRKICNHVEGKAKNKECLE